MKKIIRNIAIILILLSAFTLILSGCDIDDPNPSPPPKFEDIAFDISDDTALAYQAAIAKTKTAIACIKAYSKPSVLGSGNGSGFLISASGYIMTNRHVVFPNDGTTKFTNFDITLLEDNGQYTKYSADYVCSSDYGSTEDFALLKITKDNAEPFNYIKFAPSATVGFGDPCVMLGNPKGIGLMAHSAAVGNPSMEVNIGNATVPKYRDMIAVNTPVNAGNSGGPLINVNGEAIGVVTMRHIASSGKVDDAVFDIGYAQKSDNAISYIKSCVHLGGNL